MAYTKTEAGYFYWHCATAALLLEHLPSNTATMSHVQRAIRMATETALGKSGVRYASIAAIERRGTDRTKWSGLGVIREHVVPVSVITERVLEARRSGEAYQWADLLDKLTDDDKANWNVVDSDSFHLSTAPFSAVIAALVRSQAVLAWITEDEDRLLKRSGLTKSMPSGAEDDPFARYISSGIQLRKL